MVPKESECLLDMDDLVLPDYRFNDVLEVVDAVVCDSVRVCLDDAPHPIVAPV